MASFLNDEKDFYDLKCFTKKVDNLNDCNSGMLIQKKALKCATQQKPIKRECRAKKY